jgi:hypothetical protein
MGLSDPFQTTYQGTLQAKSSLGDALQNIAGLYAKKKMEDKQQTKQLATQLFSHMITAGYVKPNQATLDSVKNILGIAGLDITKPQNVNDITQLPGFKTNIKTDATGKIEGVDYIPVDQAEEQRKQQEEVRKQKDMEFKQQESQQKMEELKASTAKQALAGSSFLDKFLNPDKYAQNQEIQAGMRQQALDKIRPKYDKQTQKLQYNAKTNEYRVVNK